MSLSDRVRPDVEAARWVVEGIKKLEAERDAAVKLLTEISESLDRAEDVRKTNLRTRISTYLRG